VLDLGCGVGNALFPLIEELAKKFFFYACDFSPKAITLLKQNPAYNEKLVTAFVCDISKEDLTPTIPENCGNFAILIFVLSAISPDYFTSIAAKIYKVLARGGILFLRDYGRGDLAQKRLATKTQRDASLSDNFYVRGDGTRVYYFDVDEVTTLFTSVGFTKLECDFVERTVTNRKTETDMERCWLQAKFVKF